MKERVAPAVDASTAPCPFRTRARRRAGRGPSSRAPAAHAEEGSSGLCGRHVRRLTLQRVAARVGLGSERPTRLRSGRPGFEPVTFRAPSRRGPERRSYCRSTGTRSPAEEGRVASPTSSSSPAAYSGVSSLTVGVRNVRPVGGRRRPGLIGRRSRTGIDGGSGAFLVNHGDDVHAVGTLTPIVPGHIGCVVIRPDGSRSLARAVPDPLA